MFFMQSVSVFSIQSCNSHISVVVCSFFESGTVSKVSIREWVKGSSHSGQDSNGKQFRNYGSNHKCYVLWLMMEFRNCYGMVIFVRTLDRTKRASYGIPPTDTILVAWLVVLGFNAALTAKVMSWRSVTHANFLAFSRQYQHSTNTTFFPKLPTTFLTCFSMRGENMPERKFASTGHQTSNHQITSPTRSPLSHPGWAADCEADLGQYFSQMAPFTEH